MILRARRAHRAFSLLETVTVVLIIAILALLALPIYSKLHSRAQRFQCAANLRSLAIGAEQFVQQSGMWPQITTPTADDTSMQTFAHTWIDTLKPFRIDAKTWTCPTIQTALGNPDILDEKNVRIDYFPMPFDDKPTTAHQWARHPWFMETANSHGNGPLIIFTDGSITDLNTIAKTAALLTK